MGKRIIRNVFTIIHRGRQLVGFEIESLNNKIYLTPGNIKQCTSLEIFEAELLINSKIRIEFYKKGEKMYNKKLCENDNIMVKDFWIDLSENIEELRENNEHLLKPLHTIQKVFQFTRRNIQFVGLVIEDEKVVYIQSDRLAGLTKLDPIEFDVLVGSYINPEYFKEGENISYGNNQMPVLCQKNDSILKNLNLRLNEKVEERHNWSKAKHNEIKLMLDYEEDFIYNMENEYEYDPFNGSIYLVDKGHPFDLYKHKEYLNFLKWIDDNFSRINFSEQLEEIQKNISREKELTYYKYLNNKYFKDEHWKEQKLELLDDKIEILNWLMDDKNLYDESNGERFIDIISLFHGKMIEMDERYAIFSFGIPIYDRYHFGLCDKNNVFEPNDFHPLKIYVPISQVNLENKITKWYFSKVELKLNRVKKGKCYYYFESKYQSFTDFVMDYYSFKTIEEVNIKLQRASQEELTSLKNSFRSNRRIIRDKENCDEDLEYEFNEDREYTSNDYSYKYRYKNYEKYGGGPSGDLSDDFIDDALGGEPSAYWNID